MLTGFMTIVWTRKGHQHVAEKATFGVALRRGTQQGFGIATMCNRPHVVSMEIPQDAIATCRSTVVAGTTSPWLVLRPMDESVHYRFHWDSFTFLNQSITNVTLIDVRATSADQR